MTSVNPSNSEWMLSVDFGTTSTVAAMTFAGGTTEVLEVDGERRTPSVVLVDDDGSLLVGSAAVGLAASRPERTIRSPKRRLGEQTPVVLGGKPFNPVDLVAAILRHVMAEARRHVGSEPTSIRLTHPATWSRPLQQRLLEAAAKAGMGNVELVPEPVAAAMAAAARSLPIDSYIAVYDLGGGTFDTTVVQSTTIGYVVVGHPIGDRQIGGELFDEALMNHVGSRLDPEMWEKLQVSDARDWHQAATRLLGECRRVKEALSTHSYGEIVLGTPGGMIDERVTRTELEAIVAPYLEASLDLLERCVDDVDIEPSQLAAIHMIGGASRMPLAATMVEEAFPGVEVSRRGDPRTAVAVGAAHVDLTELSAGVVADQNTTVERRPRSIDAEAAAIDAAAAANRAAREAAERGAAAQMPIAQPPNPSVITTPGPANEPAPLQPAVAAPDAGTVTTPGTISGSATTPFVGRTNPPPASAVPAASDRSTFTGSNVMPVLLGAGFLALVLVGGLLYLAFGRGGNDTDTVAVAPKDTQLVNTTPNTDPLPTVSTQAPSTQAPSTQAPSTQAPPEDTTTSTTVAAPTGPTRDDAVGLLFDVSEIPGEGWTNDTYAPQPFLPCGVVDPHAPLFSEGRSFSRNLGQVDATSITHAVFVFANETEAAAVLEYYQTFSVSCPSDTINLLGTDFAAFFNSCDPFSTCDGAFPASTSDFLPGEQYALQAALLSDDASGLFITDQIYLMRTGRSIVALEYVVLDVATEAQTNEAATIAIEAWSRAAGFPR